jgi:prephenate dehydrogenase
MTSPAEGVARRRALVVGTGLIGGSIALGLRRRGWHVSGVDADAERLREALARGVVDAAGDDPDAEIVFVAVPAGAVAGEVRRLLADPGRRADAVVSDVCGVKTAIVEAADDPRFIGGHPMAGSEQLGLRGADPDLFEGAVWVLTPTSATDLAAFDRLKGAVMSLGADVLVLSAADHDRLVAVVSHVPHLVAATLMNAASAGAEQDGALLRLAAGGFRDMTRVAAGAPGIWPDICAENAAAIVDALDVLVHDLAAVRDRVAAQDRGALLGALQRASAARRNLPARIARPDHLAELRIPVPDRAGVLAEITSLAGDAGIGIYDIEIAHSAEGPRGVLILVVDGDDAEALATAVEARGYRCTAEHLS